MKKTLVSIALLGASLTMAQVGINTEEPKATLDVSASPEDMTLIDGFIAPRLTGDELKDKDALYTAATGQTGTIIYATSASSDAGVTGTKTINVDGAGYYYFDGAIWVKFGSGTAAPGTEPWRIQNSTNEATENDDNIYQNGNVGLGDFSASNPLARLDVRGAVRAGAPHADEISGASPIGANSIALGYDNKVSGANAIAIGGLNTVTGTGRAFGLNNTVVNGTALGNGNTATGGLALGSAHNTVTNTFAMGQNGKTTALGQVFVGFANTAYPAPLTSATNETRYVNQKHLFLDQNGVNTNLLLGIGTLSPTNEVHIVPVTGQDPVRIEGLQAGVATDNIVVANSTGVLKTVAASTLVIEPWQNQSDGTKATSNTAAIYQVGNVSIGTQAPIAPFTSNGSTITPKLSVTGDVASTGSYYTTTGKYADYVFEDYFDGASKIDETYKFRSLEETANYIKENKHLPGVTPIKDILKTDNGYTVNLSELSIQQLEKIEELYLHTIEQQNLIEKQETEISDLQSRLEKLETLLLKETK